MGSRSPLRFRNKVIIKQCNFKTSTFTIIDSLKFFHFAHKTMQITENPQLSHISINLKKVHNYWRLVVVGEIEGLRTNKLTTWSWNWKGVRLVKRLRSNWNSGASLRWDMNWIEVSQMRWDEKKKDEVGGR